MLLIIMVVFWINKVEVEVEVINKTVNTGILYQLAMVPLYLICKTRLVKS